MWEGEENLESMTSIELMKTQFITHECETYTEKHKKNTKVVSLLKLTKEEKEIAQNYMKAIEGKTLRDVGK